MISGQTMDPADAPDTVDQESSDCGDKMENGETH